RRPARRVGRRTRSPRLGVRRPGPRDTPVAAQTAVGRVPGRTGRRMRAGPSPLITVPRPLKNGEQEVLESTQWRDVATGGQDPTGLGLDLPCTEDPELFFAESPQDVEQAKAMCLDCRARIACLTGALERPDPWGVWGGGLADEHSRAAMEQAERMRPVRRQLALRRAHRMERKAERRLIQAWRRAA